MADALDWLRQLLGGGQDTQGSNNDALAALQAHLATGGAADQAPSDIGPPLLQHLRGVADDIAGMGAGRAYDPTRSFAANALDPRGIEQAMNVAMSTGPGAIKAYHGSPYDFERFDLSKIGTGEGAQAYGHGLYFAGNEDVAKSYRNELADWKVGGEVADPANPVHAAAATLKAFDGDAAQAMTELRRTAELGPPEERAVAAQAIDLLRKGEPLPPVTGGRMYEAQINAEPEQFVQWDKPLSQQAPAVQQAMQSGLTDLNFTKPDAVVQLSNGRWAPTANGQVVGRQDGWPDKSTAQYVLEATSQEAEKNAKLTAGEIMSRSYGGQNMQAKSEALREAGIPGIRYLDQGSRGVGAGTHNYSVFDDKLIEILRKYGILPPLAAGAAGAGLLGSGSEPPT